MFASIDTEKERIRELEELGGQLVEALEAVFTMGHADPPRKLDDALTWRANDDKAHALYVAAIAKAKDVL